MRNSVLIVIILLIILGAYVMGKQSNNSTEVAGASADNVPSSTPSPTDTPSPTPTPTPPDFPSDITATKTFQYQAATNGTYTVTFSFNNPNARSISIGISQTEYDDPGPDPDTTGNSWTFTNVPALSTEYVNMKAMVNGTWSAIGLFGPLQIPSWQAPIRPIYYPYPVYYPQSTYTHCYSDAFNGVNCYSY